MGPWSHIHFTCMCVSEIFIKFHQYSTCMSCTFCSIPCKPIHWNPPWKEHCNFSPMGPKGLMHECSLFFRPWLSIRVALAFCRHQAPVLKYLRPQGWAHRVPWRMLFRMWRFFTLFPVADRKISLEPRLSWYKFCKLGVFSDTSGKLWSNSVYGFISIRLHSIQ